MASRRPLNVPITTDTSGLKKGVREADQELGKLEGSAKRTGAALVTHIGSSGTRAGVMFKQGIAPMAGIALAAGVAAGAALGKGIAQQLDIEDAQAKLRVQLGLTEKESGRYGRLAGQLFASNYGDSLGEVNDALKNVVTNIDGLREASGSRLKGITGDVIQVSKAFDQDLGGVTRAVGQLMRTGLAKNAQEALNVITVGFQRGADKSEDFLDTLNEYGTQFRKLGIDGKTATGLISQGLQAGARDADIVADAIKEFSIRAVDGSDTTAAGFKAIGLSAKDMGEQVGRGGKGARQGLDEVLDRLRAIKDPVKQSQAAVALFGTQAEDLGKALYSLDPSRASNAIGKVGGAARKLNETMGATPKSQIETFWRTLQTGGTSALSKVTPLLGRGAAAATDFIKGMRSGSGAGGEFGSRVSNAVNRVKAVVSAWVSKNRGDINSVVNAFRTVAKFAQEVFIDTALPIIKRYVKAAGDVISGLVHIVRGVVRLISGLISGDWKKAWDGAKEIVSGAWKIIKASIVNLAGNILEVVKDLGPKIIKGILVGLKNIGSALATGIFEGIKAAAKAVPGLAGAALKGIGKAITGAISSGFGALNPFGDVTSTVNSNFPGTAGGGLLGGMPTSGLQSEARDGLAFLNSRFGGLRLTSGRRSPQENARVGGAPNSDHLAGLATDLVPSEGWTAKGVARLDRIAAWARTSPLIRWIGWRGVPGHGPGDHLHLSWVDRVAGDVAMLGGKLRAFGGRVRGVGDVSYTAQTQGWKNGPRGPLTRNQVAALAESVGLPGVTFADIARGESGYDPDNIGHDPGGTVGLGLWQITTKFNDDIIRRFGGPKAILDPLTNAKAAKAIWDRQGRGAWVGTQFVTDWNAHYHGSLGNVPSSRGGAFKPSSGVGKITGPNTAGGVGSLNGGLGQDAQGKGGHRAGATGPGGYSYQGALDTIGLARSQSTSDTRTVQLNAAEGIALQRRLRKITTALKGKLGPSKRSELMQEAAAINDRLRTLGEETNAIFNPVVEAGEPVEAPTPADWALSAIARARLTPGLGDDIAAATTLRDVRKSELDAALGDTDPRNDADAIDAFQSAEQAIKELTGAIDQTVDLAQALNDLQAEIKRQTDFAEGVTNTNNFQLTKTLADLLGGQIVGYGVAGRSFTPGTGVEYAY